MSFIVCSSVYVKVFALLYHDNFSFFGRSIHLYPHFTVHCPRSFYLILFFLGYVPALQYPHFSKRWSFRNTFVPRSFLAWLSSSALAFLLTKRIMMIGLVFLSFRGSVWHLSLGHKFDALSLVHLLSSHSFLNIAPSHRLVAPVYSFSYPSPLLLPWAAALPPLVQVVVFVVLPQAKRFP